MDDQAGPIKLPLWPPLQTHFFPELLLAVPGGLICPKDGLLTDLGMVLKPTDGKLLESLGNFFDYRLDVHFRAMFAERLILEDTLVFLSNGLFIMSELVDYVNMSVSFRPMDSVFSERNCATLLHAFGIREIDVIPRRMIMFWVAEDDVQELVDTPSSCGDNVSPIGSKRVVLKGLFRWVLTLFRSLFAKFRM